MQVLYLSCNYIKDINVLEKVDFKHLQQLNLNDNKISDIKVLENIDFKQLRELNLSFNQISKKENSSIISCLKSKISKFLY